MNASDYTSTERGESPRADLFIAEDKDTRTEFIKS